MTEAKPKPAPKSKRTLSKAPKETAKLMDKFETEDQFRNFFTDRSFEKYWYVDFEEFREIFGDSLDQEALGRVKKYWVEKNVTYFNMSYDLLWYIKWVPISLQYIHGLARLRLISMPLTFLYLEAVDFFLEPVVLHYYKNRRIIQVPEAFDYHLTKEKFQVMRWGWFTNYLDIIKENIAAGVPLGPDKDKILVRRMNRKSVDDPLFVSIDAPQEEKEPILFKKQIDSIKKGTFLKDIEKYVKENITRAKAQAFKEKAKAVYFEYKMSQETFPERKDFEATLDPIYLPGERRLTFKDDITNKTRSFVRTLDYAIGTNAVEDFLSEAGILPVKERTKKEKPKLGLRNNYADFVLFSVAFLAPWRVLKSLKNWKYIKYRARPPTKVV